jgi:hypothetical protein
MATSFVMANNAFDRPAGSHSLAAAGQRERSPALRKTDDG